MNIHIILFFLLTLLTLSYALSIIPLPHKLKEGDWRLILARFLRPYKNAYIQKLPLFFQKSYQPLWKNFNMYQIIAMAFLIAVAIGCMTYNFPFRIPWLEDIIAILSLAFLYSYFVIFSHFSVLALPKVFNWIHNHFSSKKIYEILCCIVAVFFTTLPFVLSIFHVRELLLLIEQIRIQENMLSRLLVLFIPFLFAQISLFIQSNTAKL